MRLLVERVVRCSTDESNGGAIAQETKVVHLDADDIKTGTRAEIRKQLISTRRLQKLDFFIRKNDARFTTREQTVLKHCQEQNDREVSKGEFSVAHFLV